MKASVPVLNEEGPQRTFEVGDGRTVCLVRQANDGGDWALSVINTDWGSPARVSTDALGVDIAKGREITPGRGKQSLGSGAELAIEPGQVLVFVGN